MAQNFTACTQCGALLSFKSERHLGTCVDCREKAGYRGCPSCANVTFKDDVGCLLSYCKRYCLGNPQVSPVPTAAISKAYKGECPCGIPFPSKCDYHTIEAP